MLRAQRIPTAFLCHNVEAHERSGIDAILSRYALGTSSRFITHSHRDRLTLEALLPGARVRAAPLPMFGVFREGTAIPTAAARSRLALDGGDVLLFFGNIRRYKGLPVLLRALPRVLARRRCKLLVVGEFYHQEDETKALIRELGLGDHLVLVDRYVPNEEVALYFSAADLVVLPYRSASQSAIVQIAYAFQRPVVATAVGGLPEVVDHEVTGLLAPPDDPEALADAICRFFDESMGAHMAQNILERQHRFGWERMVEAIEGLVTPAPDVVPDIIPADGEERRAA
jgi:glycosyltransferase involved in cell wall biosynthesis